MTGWRLWAFVAVGLGAFVGCRPAAPPEDPVPGPPRIERPMVVEAPLPDEGSVAERTPTVPADGADAPVEASPLRLPDHPVVLRVGLRTDATEARFSCCGTLRVVAEDVTVTEADVLTIRPMPESVSRPIFRLQAAALKDAVQADRLAARLAGLTGWSGAGVVHDAWSGLHKVRVGAFGSSAEAEAAKPALRAHGVAESWIVSDGGEIREPAFRLEAAGRAWRIRGRWLVVESTRNEGIRVGEHRYGGRVLLYLNERGLLNVIDELPLEDYVRQVVPREMGPEAYPEIEALKAQAVAARTYTVRNLGEFRDEGYDICATPRCQVFGGLDAEHPRSDRAVDETSGEILLWGEEAIDALYSSTCGGHTEDVEVVFPLKGKLPYLQGTPCIEAGASSLAGPSLPGAAFPSSLTLRLLPGGDSSPAGWASRVRNLARTVGLSFPDVELGSFAAVDLHQFLERVFDLALDRRLFLDAERLAPLVEAPPVEWSRSTLRLARSLLVLRSAPERTIVGADTREELVLELAAYVGFVRIERGRFLGLEGRGLAIRDSGGPRVAIVPSEAMTIRRIGRRSVATPLSLLPGDHLELVWRDGELLAVIQELPREARGAVRTGAWRSWRMVKSRRQLLASVGQQYPGFELSDLQVLERGRSGRVGKLRLVARDGRREVLEGLAIRWALDLPDTLFEARRLGAPEDATGWEFTGRGLGHGVGLCQIGSFGMAQVGHEYRDILSHYYPGTVLGRVTTRSVSSRHAR